MITKRLIDSLIGVREEASIHKIQIDARLAQRLADPNLVDPKDANRLMRIGFRIDEWRREPNLTKKRHQWLDHAFKLWGEALELLASGETVAALDRALEAVEWSTAKESSDTLAAILNAAKQFSHHNSERREDAADNAAEWQSLADAIWEEEPQLSKIEVAKLIVEQLRLEDHRDLNANTIRRKIHR
jgi:hypothetical protein